MKKSLKRHLVSSGHVKVMENKAEQEKLDEKIIRREKKIGQVSGQAVYYLLKNGRPNSDFPLLVSILASADVDVGELNHSDKFVANWGVVCSSHVVSQMLCDIFPHSQRSLSMLVWSLMCFFTVPRFVSSFATFLTSVFLEN